MPDLSDHTKQFFRGEITNERDGGVSPATVRSAIDSYLQAPDVFFPDAQVRQAVTDELLRLVAYEDALDADLDDLLAADNPDSVKSTPRDGEPAICRHCGGRIFYDDDVERWTHGDRSDLFECFDGDESCPVAEPTDGPQPQRPTAACKHCGHGITLVGNTWIATDATGDDAVWREACPDQEMFTAEHEPNVEDEDDTDSVRYTIIDAENAFHESQGLAESALRSQLRRLGYEVDDELPIEEVIDSLNDAHEGLDIQPVDPPASLDQVIDEATEMGLLSDADLAAASDRGWDRTVLSYPPYRHAYLKSPEDRTPREQEMAEEYAGALERTNPGST